MRTNHVSLRITVVQSEDRSAECLAAFMAKTRDFCERYGLTYHRSDVSMRVPPYWRKVFLIDRLMARQDRETDWFLWLDSDAWPRDARALHALLRNHHDKAFVASPDPPTWNAPFNAGAFFVRNDARGRDLVAAWKRLYNSDRWSSERNNSTGKKTKWTTPDDWAGPEYEQGSFWKHMLYNPRWASSIAMCPWYVLCETNWKRPHRRAVVVHLAAEHKNVFCETAPGIDVRVRKMVHLRDAPGGCDRCRREP